MKHDEIRHVVAKCLGQTLEVIASLGEDHDGPPVAQEIECIGHDKPEPVSVGGKRAIDFLDGRFSKQNFIRPDVCNIALGWLQASAWLSGRLQAAPGGIPERSNSVPIDSQGRQSSPACTSNAISGSRLRGTRRSATAFATTHRAPLIHDHSLG